MGKAIRASDRTVAIVSKAYLGNSYGGWHEAFSANELDEAGNQRKLIPLRIQDCRLPAPFDSRVQIDLFHLREDFARDEVVRRLVTDPDAPVHPITETLYPGKARREPRFRRRLAALGALLKANLMAGAASVFAVVILVAAVLFIRGVTATELCVPTELRVAVNPSTYQALAKSEVGASWAEKFQDSTGSGCGSAHLTVYPVDDMTMAKALTGDWDAPNTDDDTDQPSAQKAGDSANTKFNSFQLIGPEPDIWIPSSTLAIDWARSQGAKRLPASSPSLGSTPIVAIMSQAAQQAVGGKIDAGSIAHALAAKVQSRPLSLHRPASDSGAGLTALLDLYHALAGQTLDKDALADHRSELGVLESRTVSSVCDAADSESKTPIVTVVPEQLAEGTCKRPGSIVVKAGFGALNYSFVTFNDLPDGAKHLAADLQKFLTGANGTQFRADNDLQVAKGPSTSDPAQIDAVRDARMEFRPPTDVLFALDVSASMEGKDSGLGGQTKNKVAQDAIRQALAIAGADDRAAAWRFAGSATPVVPFQTAATDAERNDFFHKLYASRKAPPAGTAIYTMVAQAAESGFPAGAARRPGSARVIILVTDGRDEEPNAKNQAARAARALNVDPPISLLVLSIGGGACRTGLAVPAVCLPVTSPLDLAVAMDRISGELWGGVS